ncbi:unnamed protein product [Ambrosiozyma monospora]|uniref:Small ribosomal subunit protein uS11m n=1 Tax=Ambrosiozyma monospora TaxID=43982 RepID=A0A9W6YVV0_AMBMO|nr:unnamed protein product [Ambrosiozyma monospora]
MFKNIIRIPGVKPIGSRLFSSYKPAYNGASTIGSILKESQSQQQNANPLSTIKKQQKKISSYVTLKYVLHCKFKKNNTFLTLTKVQMDENFEHNNPDLSYNDKVLYYLTLPQKVVYSQSTGAVGFRKAQRGEYEGGFQLTSYIFKYMKENRLLEDTKNLEIVVREFGKGRKAFFDALKGKEGSGIRECVTKMSDLTPIKFGGVRSPAKRRI